MTKYFTRKKRLMSVGLALALGIGGCAAPTVEPTGFTIGLTGDTQTPPYSRVPYQPFTREAAVQIAYREWRAFGQPVVLPLPSWPLTMSGPRDCGSGSATTGGWAFLSEVASRISPASTTKRPRLCAAGGWKFRLVRGVHRLRHADGRCGPPLSLFAEPFRLHQCRPARIWMGGYGSTTRKLPATGGDLICYSRGPAHALCRAADWTLSGSLRRGRRGAAWLTGRDRRQC
jgi:hypothetical protein